MDTRPAVRPPAWRILVAGGGTPSLAVSLALAGNLGEAVDVSVFDPALGRPGRPDPRAFALSPASVRMLEALGVWPALRDVAEPITGMTITDSRTGDAVPPDYLRFEAGPDGPLAVMVEAAPLADALLSACRGAGVGLEAASLSGAVVENNAIATTTGAGTRRNASLLVAADGARSRLREEAGIGWTGRRYRQLGLVGSVSHERPHRGRAVQHFLPGGPFAILPLAGPGRAHPHRSSIVWTEEEALADRIVRAPPAEALAALEERFGHALGAIALDTPLLAHPLAVGVARRFVGPRMALLGDAAHEIHPLAGQGLNLGLADAAALAERVADAVRLGLDPGGPEVLGAYERDRRFDAVRLAGLTDALNRLFSNDRLPTRVLRDLGLGLVDRADGLKDLLVAEAAGTAGRAPRLMRGEAL